MSVSRWYHPPTTTTAMTMKLTAQKIKVSAVIVVQRSGKSIHWSANLESMGSNPAFVHLPLFFPYQTSRPNIKEFPEPGPSRLCIGSELTK